MKWLIVKRDLMQIKQLTAQEVLSVYFDIIY